MDRSLEKQVVAFMRQEQMSSLLIDHFIAHYRRFVAGETGKVTWTDVSPMPDANFLDTSTFPQLTTELQPLAKRLACIKLNGGLGTTMHLEGAKSLVPVALGKTFLDTVIAQVNAFRKRFRVRLPLLLMNSFRTQQESLRALGSFSNDGLPLDFLQNRVPRIDARTKDVAKVKEPWAPPGHGDLYLSLEQNGILEALLKQGFRWVMVSNVDNLAATPDLRTLVELDRLGVDFALELTSKTLGRQERRYAYSVPRPDDVARAGASTTGANGSIRIVVDLSTI